LVELYDFATVDRWLGAYWLRYNLGSAGRFWRAWRLLPLVLIVQGGALLFFGTHRGVWRYLAADQVRILKAVVAGAALLFVSLFFYTRLEHIAALGVFSIRPAVAVLLGGAHRLSPDRDHYFGTDRKEGHGGRRGRCRRCWCAICVQRNREFTTWLFHRRSGQTRQGDPRHSRFRRREQIPVLCERWGIDLILIAMPSASSAQMQRAVSYSERPGCRFAPAKLHGLVVGMWICARCARYPWTICSGASRCVWAGRIHECDRQARAGHRCRRFHRQRIVQTVGGVAAGMSCPL
jgi:FlaA1/EpsC-like NDP-sugar epimerase